MGKSVTTDWWSLLDELDDAVSLLDLQGRVVLANRGAAELSGLEPGELAGRDWPEILAGLADTKMDCPYRRVLTSGRVEREELRIRSRWYEVMACPIRSGRGALVGVGCVIRDVSEHKKAKERATATAREMAFLSRSAIAFVENVSDEALFQFVAAEVAAVSGAPIVTVSEVDETAGESVVRAAAGDPTLLERLRVRLGRDPAGLAFTFTPEHRRRMEVRWLTRLAGGLHELVFEIVPREVCEDIERELGLGGIWVMPFSVRGGVLGALAVMARNSAQVPNARLIEAFALQAAVAFQRRRARRAQRKAEDDYRTILETAHEGVWVIDAKAVTTHANQRMAEMLGYTVEKMLGRHLTTFMDESEAPRAKELLVRREQGVREIHEFSFRRKDGSPLWTLMSASPLPGPDGRYGGALAVVTDITSRKRAEMALVESQERLRLALAAAGMGTWSGDPSTGRIALDATLNGLLGLEPVDTSITVEEMVRHVHPDDRRALSAALRQALRDGQIQDFEFRTTGVGEGVRWLRVRGKTMGQGLDSPGRFSGVAVDVTELRSARRAEEDRARLAEENLRQREFVRRLMSEIPAGVAVVLGPDHRYILANAIYRERIAHGKGELVGRTLAEVWPELPSSVPVFDRVLRTGQSYQRVDRPYRVIRDGRPEEWFLTISLWPLRDPAGDVEGVMILVQETTKEVGRRRRAEALASVVAEVNSGREVEQVLKTTLRRAAELLAGQDGSVDLLESDGRTLRGVAEILPLGRVDAVSGRCGLPSGLSHAKVRKGVFVTLPETTGAAREWFEWAGVWGCLVTPLKVEERRVGFLCVNFTTVGYRPPPEDVAFVEAIANHCALAIDRARAHEERGRLLAAEHTARFAAEHQAAQMGAILENVREGVIVTDATGKVALRNQRAREIIGAETSGPTDSGIGDLLGLDGTPVPAKEAPVSRLLAQESFVDQEFRLRRADGTERRVLASGSPVRDRTGEASLGVLTYHDVTELRRLEHLKDEFLQVLAHELRNPLAAAFGLVQLVIRDLEPGSRGRGALHLRLAESELERLNGLVNEIISGYRVSSGRLPLDVRPIDLADVLTQSTAPYTLGFSEHVVTLTDLPAGQIRMLGDANRLVEVMANLLSNATKYSPPGGRVWVSTEVGPERAVVKVEDEGIGIPPDQLESVFEGFYRASNLTNRQPGGIGLGLYISRDIARRHGGDLWAEIRHGGGTAMHLALPLSRPPSGTVAGEPAGDSAR